MRTRRARIVFGAVAGVACSIVYGCALGLDASKIGAGGPDASLPPAPDAAGEDATPSSVSDAPPSDAAEAGPPVCALSTDCTATNACRVGSCDAGACSFAVCPTGSCQGSSCIAATSTCTAPTTYGFHASEVNVTLGAVGCGGNVASCVAAAYPFVFVGTTNGVVAYAVNDPSNPSPPAMTVTGLSFLPAFLTAMGSRVYFVGTPQGAGPSYRLPVAWLDAPSDPLATSLDATTVLEVVSVNAISSAWAGTDGSLFLSDNDPTQSLPVAHVSPPFADGATLAFFASPGVPTGASAVAPSGSRLVMAHWIGATVPFETSFSFETGAGTAAAQNSGEQTTLAAIGSTLPGAAYSQGDDGSLVWNTGPTFVDDAGGYDYSSVRATWLVANGASTQFTPTAFVDVELYVPPVPSGNLVVGPVAWIDSTTALVLAGAAGTVSNGNAGQTSVQVVVTTPTIALASGRRYVVAQSVGQVGAVASGGYGYVLAADPTGAQTCTLHIFAPACASGP